ncbi:MAG: tetratricopeptide repeat protein [bacterium]
MKTAEAYEKAGRELWHNGEYEEALKVLQDGLSHYPEHAGLRLGMAMAHLRLGNFVSARETLEDLAHRMPGSGDVLAALAEAYLSLGKRKNALKTVRKAARSHDSPAFIEYLALILAQHGLFRESIPYYKIVIAADPSRPYAWFGLGVALCRLRKLKEAVQKLEKALSLKKDFYEAASYLGNVLYDRKKRSMAVKLFMGIPPDQHMDPASLTRLIDYCKKSGKFSQLIPALEKRLQEVISGRDILKFVEQLEDHAVSGKPGMGGRSGSAYEKMAGLRFSKVWKDAPMIIPQAGELYEIEKRLTKIFGSPVRGVRRDRLPLIRNADPRAMEAFISSLASYLKAVAEKGAAPSQGPVSHWGKIWGIDDLAPYAVAVFRKMYDDPDRFAVRQVPVDTMLAAIVNLLKWMPPGLHGSEWIVELGGVIIAFWLRRDMLERLFLMREILTNTEKKCIEPLIKRGRSWRRWLGYKADRAWSYPSTELFKDVPKTLGAGQPVKCPRCRTVIKDYWDIADFNDSPPVRCGDCAPMRRCTRCQGPLRQVSSCGKGKNKMTVYRCMECYKKQGSR